MKFRRRADPHVLGFQIAPMVDVLVVLLCFFIVTWNMARKERELDVKVPTAENAGEPTPEVNQTVLNLKADGSLVMNTKPITYEELGAKMKTLATINPDYAIILRGDENVAYKFVAKVLDVCRGGGHLERRVSRFPAGGEMKKGPAIAVVILALASATARSQEDVIKPFRPDGPKPPAEEPVKPDAPLKPFRPGIEPKDVAPVVPKVVTPKKPAESPSPPEPEPVRAKPVQRPAAPVAESPEIGDIVVRPGVAPSTPDQVQLQFADGYYGKKMWREAAPEYERYLDKFPKAPPLDRQAAYYRLGECYRHAGATNNAKTNYDAILTNFNAGEFVGYAAWRLAEIYYAEKDYRGALPIYRRASVRLTQPTLINASKFFIARCLEANGQKTEARVQYEDLSKVIDANPYRDASRLSVGRLLDEGKQRAEALKWLKPLAAETTNDSIKADALARSGLLELDLNQHAEAIETLQAVLELPDVGVWRNELHVGVYRALFGKKDYAGVIARYEKGIPDGISVEAKLNILIIVANAFRELGKQDAAMAIYDQVVKEFPSTPQSRDAAYARIRMLYDTGDGRLLDEINRFLTDNPTAVQVERVSLMKGEVLFRNGDWANAAAIYQIIVEKARGLAGDHKGEATFRLGWCWMQLGQFEKAIGVFAVFRRDHPLHAKIPIALAQQGAAHMQLKQYNAAAKHEELVTKHPKAKEREFGLENLAIAYGQLGDQARMGETFEILLRDFPETPAKAKAHYWIGYSSAARKDYKKVVPHMRGVLDIAKGNAEVKEQYFEKASRALITSLYNTEDVEGIEKEIERYRADGGAGEVESDIIRWLGQKQHELGEQEKAISQFQILVNRKEASPEDIQTLARAQGKLGKFKDAVGTFDAYLGMVKDALRRAQAMLEKTDAQIALKDWAGADATIKDGLAIAPEGKYNGEFRFRAGEVEEGRGNLEKAAKVFESIPVTLEDDDVCPRSLERAARVQRALGNEAEAKRLENQLRSRYPEYFQKKRATPVTPVR